MKNVTKYLSLLLGILLLPLLTSCSAAGSSAAPTPDLQTTAAVSSEASPEAVPGYFQDAAGSNIVYNLRGIWSILLIQFLSQHFKTDEGSAGRAVMTRRFVGAALMVASVALIVT